MFAGLTCSCGSAEDDDAFVRVENGRFVLDGKPCYFLGTNFWYGPILGSKGPGETQLETDRRHIHRKIDKLKADLEEVRRVRATQRDRRSKNEIPVVAIVGYTNAGKSTLLNALTGAGIPANNRLFDTLDTTSRQLTVSDTCQAILSDTVGFIAKLPHHLIEAFQATLEELQYADLILHVIDASDPDRNNHIEVAERLIAQLCKPGTPVIECYNKSDVAEDELFHVKLLLPYSAAGLVDLLHQKAKVTELSYEDGGIVAQAVVDEQVFGKIRDYVVTE